MSYLILLCLLIFDWSASLAQDGRRLQTLKGACPDQFRRCCQYHRQRARHHQIADTWCCNAQGWLYATMAMWTPDLTMDGTMDAQNENCNGTVATGCHNWYDWQWMPHVMRWMTQWTPQLIWLTKGLQCKQLDGAGAHQKKSARSECLMAPSGQGAHLSFDRKGSRIRTLVNAWLPTWADMIICLQQTSR